MTQTAAQRAGKTLPEPGLTKYLVADLPSLADLRPYLERMDAVRQYTNFGPLALEFEQKLTALLAVADPHPEYGPISLTTMVTCYHALEVGLRMLGVQTDGKVLIPAVTFPACPLAARHLGAEPVLADIDPVHWVLTPAIAWRAAQSMKLAAVMPVAVYGIPLEVAGWNEFSRDTGVPVIIDAAAAIENQEIPRRGIVAHSLHATKPFGVGEGGLLVSRDSGIVGKARIYSNFGTIDRIAQSDGANTKMSEYHAAVGLAQAARWPSIKKKRRILFDHYRHSLKSFAGRISLHPSIDRAVVSLLMLKFKEPLSPDIVARAREDGLTLHHTYLPPLYRHPYFAGLSTVNAEGEILSGGASGEKKAVHMTHSEMMRRHIIGVPFHPFLDDEDVEKAVVSLRLLTD